MGSVPTLGTPWPPAPRRSWIEPKRRDQADEIRRSFLCHVAHAFRAVIVKQGGQTSISRARRVPARTHQRLACPILRAMFPGGHFRGLAMFNRPLIPDRVLLRPTAAAFVSMFPIGKHPWTNETAPSVKGL